VDATVVRYHSGDYDRALGGLDRAARRAAEGTLGGLRFVRNRMGYHADPADFVRPRQAAGGGDLPVAGWISWAWRRAAVIRPPWPGSPHLAGHRQPAAQPVRRLTGAARSSTRPGRRPMSSTCSCPGGPDQGYRIWHHQGSSSYASCSCRRVFGLVAIAGRGDLGDELAHPAPGQAEPPGHGPLAQRLRDRRRVRDADRLLHIA
jgi:hypothetical protein